MLDAAQRRGDSVHRKTAARLAHVGILRAVRELREAFGPAHPDAMGEIERLEAVAERLRNLF